MAYNYVPKNLEDGIDALGGVGRSIDAFTLVWNYFEKKNQYKNLGEYLKIDKNNYKFKVGYDLIYEVVDKERGIDKNELKGVTFRKKFIDYIKTQVDDTYDDIDLTSVTFQDFEVGSGSKTYTTNDQEDLQVIAMSWFQACENRRITTSLGTYISFINSIINDNFRDNFSKVLNYMVRTTILSSGTSKNNILKVIKLFKDNRSWITSSYYSAEKFHNSHYQINYRSNVRYIFAHAKSNSYLWVKKYYKELYNKISKDKLLPISSRIDENKWNPADMYVIDASTIGDKENVNSIRMLIDENRNNDPISVLEKYNQKMKEWMDNGRFISISLKKSGKNINLKSINYNSDRIVDKEYKNIIDIINGLKNAKSEDDKIKLMQKLILLKKIKYDNRNQKLVIEFSIDIDGDGNEDSWEKYKFDARSFSGGDGNIQLQLMYAGAARSALGKISYPVVDDIINQYPRQNLYYGELNTLRKKSIDFIFDRNKPMLPDYVKRKINSKFERYSNKFLIVGRGKSIFDEIYRIEEKDFKVGKDILIEYAGLLSGESVNILKNKNLSYLKNKIQVYEIGKFFDKNTTIVNRLIRKKVLLSIFLYASSRGLTFFMDNQTQQSVVNTLFRGCPHFILG